MADVDHRSVRVAGVDGTKGGWIAIVLDRGRFAGAYRLPLETRFDELDDVSVIAIDVPIGYGPREADKAARAYLPGMSSTVFTTPTRAQLDAPFGPGLGVSAQAHALGRRIIHVTKLARSDTRLREVHPEVSFRAMNGGKALASKKSARGVLERMRLLREHGIDLLDAAAPAPIGELLDAAAEGASIDDVLDAAAAAWSAHRIALGEARSLPDPPEWIDGRPVAIWY